MFTPRNQMALSQNKQKLVRQNRTNSESPSEGAKNLLNPGPNRSLNVGGLSVLLGGSITWSLWGLQTVKGSIMTLRDRRWCTKWKSFIAKHGTWSSPESKQALRDEVQGRGNGIGPLKPKDREWSLFRIEEPHFWVLLIGCWYLGWLVSTGLVGDSL